MLIVFKDYLKARKDPERKKAQQENLNKKLTILKQRKIEQFETNQSWHVVFGKQKSAMKLLPKFIDMTYRNIWMEENYIYNQAVKLNPSEILHKPAEYALEWQPPDSTFRVTIHLDDQKAQADTLRRISFYPKPLQQAITFYFTTVSKNMDLFGEKVHPSATESYHDRPSVLRKLCEKYMKGILSLEDLNLILEAGYSTWKIALYNLLDEEEQSYHHYLQEPPPKVMKKSLERQYLDDNIDLQQYEDLKFPIRKAKRDEEAMSYPRPYHHGKCIICKAPHVAIVKCLHCSNVACPSCIHRVFLDEKTSEGSFLLLHRRYCVRLGAYPIITPAVEPEPGYLRELRLTGLLAAEGRHHARQVTLSEEERRKMLEEEALRKKNDPDSDSDSDEEPEEMVEPVVEEKTQEEIDNEPLIMKFLIILESCAKKMENGVPEIKKMHQVLDNPGRGVTVRERIQRMKDEKVQKLERTMKKVEKCRKKLQPFENLERVSVPLAECAEFEATLRRVLSVQTWAEYEEILQQRQQLEEARQAAALMSTLVM